MSALRIEVGPVRRGIRNDGPTELVVLIRVIPPTPEIQFVRPSINLGLALDRSGSMASGRTMHHAREAAANEPNNASARSRWLQRHCGQPGTRTRRPAGVGQTARTPPESPIARRSPGSRPTPSRGIGQLSQHDTFPWSGPLVRGG